MIKFEDITMRFGGLYAINRCSFEIPAGKITGLIGPNGAGKTTAFNVIAGLLTQTSGKILLDGEDVSHLKPHQRQIKGLSRTFQLTHEFSRMTVLENLQVAGANSVGENIFNAILFPQRCQQQEAVVLAKALEMLEFLEIEQIKDELAGNVSGGQKKLMELGRALMQDPKIILLDEIGAGINRILLGKIADKIKQLNVQQGYTFCLIEHDLEYVSKLCDKVVVMTQGELLMTGSVSQVRNDERVIEAYFGGGKYQEP